MTGLTLAVKQYIKEYRSLKVSSLFMGLNPGGAVQSLFCIRFYLKHREISISIELCYCSDSGPAFELERIEGSDNFSSDDIITQTTLAEPNKTVRQFKCPMSFSFK